MDSSMSKYNIHDGSLKESAKSPLSSDQSVSSESYSMFPGAIPSKSLSRAESNLFEAPAKKDTQVESYWDKQRKGNKSQVVRPSPLRFDGAVFPGYTPTTILKPPHVARDVFNPRTSAFKSCSEQDEPSTSGVLDLSVPQARFRSQMDCSNQVSDVLKHGGASQLRKLFVCEKVVPPGRHQKAVLPAEQTPTFPKPSDICLPAASYSKAAKKPVTVIDLTMDDEPAPKVMRTVMTSQSDSATFYAVPRKLVDALLPTHPVAYTFCQRKHIVGALDCEKNDVLQQFCSYNPLSRQFDSFPCILNFKVFF